MVSCGRQREAQILRPPPPPSPSRQDRRHVGEGDIDVATDPIPKRLEHFKTGLHLNKAGLDLGTFIVGADFSAAEVSGQGRWRWTSRASVQLSTGPETEYLVFISYVAYEPFQCSIVSFMTLATFDVRLGC